MAPRVRTDGEGKKERGVPTLYELCRLSVATERLSVCVTMADLAVNG